MIRKAIKDDIKVLEGLQEFIESLEIDILKNYSIVKIQDILKFDRFSYKNCTVYENDGKIRGFSFSYHYNEVEKMKKFWFNEVVKKFNLKQRRCMRRYECTHKH